METGLTRKGGGVTSFLAKVDEEIRDCRLSTNIAELRTYAQEEVGLVPQRSYSFA
jgi:hypothetical protein